MIKKLRIKFIIVSMVSLLIVLCITIGSICILNYRKVISDADNTLSILAENKGFFPEWNSKMRSPELSYESRYFFVSVSNGGIASVNTGKIAAVDTSTAIEYTQEVLEKERDYGFIENYRYRVSSYGAETQVIFLDCGRSLDIFKTFVFASMGVSAAGILGVFILIIFLSRRIIKPFSENYEKQKRFITDAGHELKTPLTIIDADAEILEMDYGENEWLGDIKSQTKRLAELTNSLILLARMEEEQPRTQMIDFSLSDMAEDSVGTFQALAKTQQKTLTGKIQPMISMRGDEKAIGRLVHILLDNAIKYAEPYGRISLTLEKQKNLICLSVLNTTEYISQENLKYLFDRFYRTDKSRNSQTGGYGLGLSIASAIVSAHKGKISATTEDEKSLLVTVVFPA